MNNKSNQDRDHINKNIRTDILTVRPKHRLGQNFLFDEVILSNIVKACSIEPHESVLELGSGAGTLTHELALISDKILGIEIDESLIYFANKHLSIYPSISFMHEDILNIKIDELVESNKINKEYIAVGNIPYYITQPILQLLLYARPQPNRIVLMTQRELANRIVGGNGKESFLSLLVQIYGHAYKAFDLPANAFWPIPKVNSSLIVIDIDKNKNIHSAEETKNILSVIKVGFSAPRKQIHNVLKMSLDVDVSKIDSILRKASIEPSLRAQHVPLASWMKLADIFNLELTSILTELREQFK
jgi:16S rRNA (adenine1518-N6/adenine1519-N6)-dimethyltransferase|tara:strand:+ start:4760 stop:5665 length:906 start_codon:yes stop_codon:yes gene_type:complete